MNKFGLALAALAISGSSVAADNLVKTPKWHMDGDRIVVPPLPKSASCQDHFNHGVASQMVRYVDNEEIGAKTHVLYAPHKIDSMLKNYETALLSCLGKEGLAYVPNKQTVRKLKGVLKEVPKDLPVGVKGFSYLQDVFYRRITTTILPPEIRRIEEMIAATDSKPPSDE